MSRVNGTCKTNGFCVPVVAIDDLSVKNKETREKTSALTRDEIHKLIVNNLIMRDQETLTYQVSQPNNNTYGTSEYVYHRIPMKIAQFNEQDDVGDINEVQVHVNDKVTITTNNEKSGKSYWLHPKGFIIKNSDRFVVEMDEKALK